MDMILRRVQFNVFLEFLKNKRVGQLWCAASCMWKVCQFTSFSSPQLQETSSSLVRRPFEGPSRPLQTGLLVKMIRPPLQMDFRSSKKHLLQPTLHGLYIFFSLCVCVMLSFTSCTFFRRVSKSWKWSIYRSKWLFTLEWLTLGPHCPNQIINLLSMIK